MNTLQESALPYPASVPALINAHLTTSVINPVTKKKVRGIWSDAVVEQIKILVAEKLTAEEIGNRLGFSRSQILGICWRRGIQVGERRPSKNHVPKQRTIGKRLIRAGQAATPMVLALPDQREVRPPEERRIIRKAVARPKIQLTPDALVPSGDTLPKLDAKVNSSGAAFLRQFKNRTAKKEAVAVPSPTVEPQRDQAKVETLVIPPKPVLAPVVAPLSVDSRPAATAKEAASADAEPQPVLEPKHRLSIFELKANHCRYPVSGTGVSMFYCGEPAMADKPYCSDCAKICYEKPEKIAASKKAPRKVSAFAFRTGIHFH